MRTQILDHLHQHWMNYSRAKHPWDLLKALQIQFLSKRFIVCCFVCFVRSTKDCEDNKTSKAHIVPKSSSAPPKNAPTAAEIVAAEEIKANWRWISYCLASERFSDLALRIGCSSPAFRCILWTLISIRYSPRPLMSCSYALDLHSASIFLIVSKGVFLSGYYFYSFVLSSGLSSLERSKIQSWSNYWAENRT